MQRSSFSGLKHTAQLALTGFQTIDQIKTYRETSVVQFPNERIVWLVILVNQKHPAQAVLSDTWIKSSYESVLFSDSKHAQNQWHPIYKCKNLMISYFSESKTSSTTGEVQFLNECL